MFGQLAREEETDSSLDFPGGDGGPLVVVGQTASLTFDLIFFLVPVTFDILYTVPPISQIRPKFR